MPTYMVDYNGDEVHGCAWAPDDDVDSCTRVGVHDTNLYVFVFARAHELFASWTYDCNATPRLTYQDPPANIQTSLRHKTSSLSPPPIPALQKALTGPASDDCRLNSSRISV